MAKKLQEKKEINGEDKNVFKKQQTTDLITEELELNEKLKKIGNELVFKHLLVKKLVDECLKTHKKEHDEDLAAALYDRFMNELE